MKCTYNEGEKLQQHQTKKEKDPGDPKSPEALRSYILITITCPPQQKKDRGKAQAGQEN